MELLSQIIELVKEFWERLMPFFIVNHYDSAIVLRFGKFTGKEYGAGIHWKIPLADSVNEVRKTTTTLNVRPQSLTTKCGRAIVISAVIKYSIQDATKFILDVENAADAIGDISQGKIKAIVASKTWEELQTLKDVELKNKIKDEAAYFGVKISFVTITDLAQIKTLRLIQ